MGFANPPGPKVGENRVGKHNHPPKRRARAIVTAGHKLTIEFNQNQLL